MSYLIGTDEAGYGPNLGPLTVTGTLWDNQCGQACLYDALENVIKPAPDRKSDGRLVVADSKGRLQNLRVASKKLENHGTELFDRCRESPIKKRMELRQSNSTPFRGTLKV